MRSLAFLVLIVLPVFGSSADPQVKTDHPWYPGELSCSTWERLFKAQAELYKRVTGRETDNDEDKALASWYWRNLNVHHSTDGNMDLYGTGFQKSDVNREYWTGLFGYGYSLCFTTHAQYCAEMEKLLGHCRARACGVPGHTSFEVFLTGGNYGAGRWVLLDHDVSTVIFHEDGSRLISIGEISAELGKYKNPQFKPERQRGWLVGGLHPSDPGAYSQLKNVSYEFGYYGAPPRLHLRSGESVRRYVRPGLEDGKTWVYWGINYMQKAKDDPAPIPGPARDRSWVNQPDKMYGSKKGTGWIPGQARYGNAVYTYTPNFKNGSYKEGILDESEKHVTFEFYTPYVIGCTPKRFTDDAGKALHWGIYEDGATNGLLLKGAMSCPVKISIDQGATWKDAGTAKDGMDLTDHVKGTQQYFIRFEESPSGLADSGLSIRTVCQTNFCMIPRLKDGETHVTFNSSGLASLAAGPNLAQAKARLVDGAFDSAKVTLELKTPRGEPAVHVYAHGHVSSGSPPKPVKYQIEYSTDGGKAWKPIVKDWTIERRPYEPGDFWSQSMCFGDAALEDVKEPVRVRFHNDGNRIYKKGEMHLVYRAANPGATEVTFAWREGKDGELKTESKVYPHTQGEDDTSWGIKTGENVETVWVEYKALSGD